MEQDVVKVLLGYLASMDALVEVRDANDDPELQTPTLAQWDFHDLLFHSRSRLGRHDKPFGGTYPFQDRFSMLPVQKPRMSNEGGPARRTRFGIISRSLTRLFPPFWKRASRCAIKTMRTRSH